MYRYLMSFKTKKLSQTYNKQTTQKTFQDTLTNTQIKDYLKEYKQASDISKVSIGTHLRYFSINPENPKEKVFRLGGTLNKIDMEKKYVILGNGQVTWSVQIPNAIFFQKLTQEEIKKEMKEEIRKEVITEMNDSDDDCLKLKEEIRKLNKKLELYSDMEKEYKNLLKKNELLTEQLNKIAKEIVIEKEKRKKK